MDIWVDPRQWTGTWTMVSGCDGSEEVTQLLENKHWRCLRDGDGARTARAEQTGLVEVSCVKK